ncbi:MAG TPA: hypothetical protein VGW34_11925 [Allosphingosinicella sp.]|nr:hypothetical protein [Allosphingosinicella sp.]
MGEIESQGSLVISRRGIEEMERRTFGVSASIDAIMTALPEWMKPGSFREIRKGILDRPKLTISKRRKHVGAYALFCATAPYLLVVSMIWAINLAGVLPSDPAQRMHEQVRAWEIEVAELRAEARMTCEITASSNPTAGRRCQALLPRMFDPLQETTETMRRDAKALEAARFGFFNAVAGAVAIILNAFFFTRLWLRFHPEHVQRRQEDVDKVWSAYLLVMATTMFIPNCIGATIVLLVEILTRLEPAAVGAASSWLLFAGLLPFAVCGVLGSYRLNWVLLESSDWRIRNTWWIMLASNAATIMSFYALLVFAYILYFFS